MKSYIHAGGAQPAMRLLILLFLLTMLFRAQAQEDSTDWREMITDPTANFYEVQAAADAWFAAHPDEKDQPGKGYKDFKRWENFWNDRVHDEGGLKTGDMTYASKAMASYLADPICTDQLPPSEWSALGPFSQARQVMGIITALWVDPNDQDHVLAGSNSGGLFESFDATTAAPTWANISEAGRLPAMGIRKIIVQQDGNTETIFVATGQNTYARSYGIGLVKLVRPIGGAVGNWQSTN
ncbi:MAG: hypothetical protein AAF206_21650, partial [Bacteroidota bacterium]